MSRTKAGWQIWEGVAEYVEQFQGEQRIRLILSFWDYCNSGIPIPKDLASLPMMGSIIDQLDGGMARSIESKKKSDEKRQKTITAASAPPVIIKGPNN